MAALEFADVKQLLDAMENRIGARFDVRFDALEQTMHEGFAAVGEAIERIYQDHERYDAELSKHARVLRRLDPSFDVEQ